MAISIQYNLVGRGWAECIVEIEHHQARLTASYLADALDGLLDAVAVVTNAADESTASFVEEPGEYRWCFKRTSQERLSVRIVWFDKAWSNRSDEKGKVILEAECRLRTFAGAILSASQRVLATHGLEGYREKWVNYAFPIRSQAKLQEALR